MTSGVRPRGLRAWRGTLRGRLLAWHSLTFVAVLAALGLALESSLERAFLADLTDSLTREAVAVGRALPAGRPDLQPAVSSLGAELGVRVTVVAPDGTVLADSHHDPAGMENHARRPEVRAALAGERGVDSRTSDTLGEPFRYVALPGPGGVVVRVALPLDSVQARLRPVRRLVGTAAALGALAGILAAPLIARGLTEPLRRMADAAGRVGAGEPGERIPVEGTAETRRLAETLNRMAAELQAGIEEAARDREVRDQILAAMDAGVLLVEPEGGVEYLNPAAGRLLGRPPDADSRIPAVLPRVRTLADGARSRAEVRQDEMEVGHPPVTVHASAVPIGADGRVLVVLRDVTATRRLDAVRRDFVAAASHELKTPIASIRAGAETVVRALDEDAAAARRFAVQVERDAERLSRIVMDLLDLSRLESETPEMHPVRLDLLAREEAGRFADQARRAGIALELDAASPVEVHGSPKDLALCVRNLLDNAFRYTTAGRVRVEVLRAGGAATLAVEDTGVGIPARDLPRVFERFFRVDRARSRETGGTGLGLSIARHVAEQHGGRLEAESELGAGSTFRLVLPWPGGAASG